MERYTGVSHPGLLNGWMSIRPIGWMVLTRKYQIHALVWYELQETMESAILREKQIKKWRRSWKLGLIEGQNPEWQDLSNDLV